MVTIAIRRRRQQQNDRIAGDDGLRTNRDIRGYRLCRLIDEDGSQLGMFDVRDALYKAQDKGLDLVEMSPDADPPVCKIMNYSKFRYEQQKKQKANRRRGQETKQMKFRCKIDDGDYDTKLSHVRRFLEDGNKVRITIMFRGREVSHSDIGRGILDRIAEDLREDARVDQAPLLEGRNMTMLLSPTQVAIGRGVARKREAQAAAEAAEAGKAERRAKQGDAR